MYHGYTGHEMMDEVGLIHMNGRLYDPVLGRFVSADFVIQSPDNLQSYNRYTYAWNNPMAGTDPSGQWCIPCIGAIIGALSAGAQSNWDIGAMAKGAVIGAISAWAGQAAFGAAGGGFGGSVVGGAAGSFMNAFLTTGGDLNAAGQAAVQGGVTAGLFYGAGSFADGMGEMPGANKSVWEHGGIGRVMAHAAAGCAGAMASGGSCGRGAMTAGLSEGIGGNLGEKYDGVIARAVVGGTVSVIGGGKFANGAVMGAYGYLFNCMGHPDTCGGGRKWNGFGPPPLVADANANLATQLTRAWNNFWDAVYDSVTYSKPPQDAYDPNGPKAPGKPGSETGFRDPKGGENWVPNPNGRGSGWEADDGRVWVPTGLRPGNAHGGPHWDVQTPGRPRDYENVYPDSGRRR
jgi:RHS repeat-associated protein